MEKLSDALNEVSVLQSDMVQQLKQNMITRKKRCEKHNEEIVLFECWTDANGNDMEKPYSYVEKDCIVCENEREAKKKAEEKITWVNIPKRYSELEFEDYITSDNPITKLKQKRILSEFKEYTNNYKTNEGKSYIFTGNYGTGKTMLSIIILKELVQKYCLNAVYKNYNLFLAELKATFEETGNGQDGLMRKLLNCDFLILDEIDHESNTKNQWTMDKLYNIVNHRYERMKSSIYITNEPKKRFSKIFNGKVADRFNDRQFETIEFSWESARGKL